MSDDACPCCTNNPPPIGKRTWTTLCIRCLRHVVRMEPCWHETKDDD